MSAFVVATSKHIKLKRFIFESGLDVPYSYILNPLTHSTIDGSFDDPKEYYKLVEFVKLNKFENMDAITVTFSITYVPKCKDSYIIFQRDPDQIEDPKLLPIKELHVPSKCKDYQTDIQNEVIRLMKKVLFKIKQDIDIQNTYHK